MISKFFKIIFIIISFFFANQANSKNIDYNFNKSELSNYLSAIISFNNHENEQSLNYFNSSKRLLRNHENYLKQYVFSLVVNQKVKRAIQEIKVLENKENNVISMTTTLDPDDEKCINFEGQIVSWSNCVL